MPGTDIEKQYKQNNQMEHSRQNTAMRILEQLGGKKLTDDQKAELARKEAKAELDQMAEEEKNQQEQKRQQQEEAQQQQEEAQKTEAGTQQKDTPSASTQTPQEKKPTTAEDLIAGRDQDLSDLIKIEDGKIRASDTLKQISFDEKNFEELNQLGKKKASITGGILRGIEQMGNSALDLAEMGETWLEEQGIGSGDLIPEVRSNVAADMFPDVGDISDRGIRILSQYAAPMGMMSRAFKVGSTTKKGYEALKFASADFAAGAIAFDPDEKRLANFFAEDLDMGIVGTMLMMNQPGQSNARKRINQGLEGLFVGGAAHLGLKAAEHLGLKAAGKLFDMYAGARAVKASKKNIGKDVSEVIQEAKAETAKLEKVKKEADELIYNAPKPETKSGVGITVDTKTGKTLVDLDIDKITDVISDPKKLQKFRDNLIIELGGPKTIKGMVNVATDKIKNLDQLAEFFGRTADEGLREEDLFTFGILREGLAQQLQKWASTTDSIVSDAKFLETLNLLRHVSNGFEGMASTAGTVLRNVREADEMFGRDGRFFINYVDNMSGGNPQSVQALKAQMRAFMSGDAYKAKLMEELANMPAYKHVFQWGVESTRALLLGTGSVVRNTVSTGIMLPTKVLSQKFAEVISQAKFTKGVSNVQPGEARVFAKTATSETAVKAKGFFNGIFEYMLSTAASYRETGFAGALKKSVKDMADIGGNRINIEGVRGVGPTTGMRLRAKGVQNNSILMAADLVDYFRLASFRTLGATDDAYKAINRAAGTEMMAHRRALESGVIDGSKEYVDFIGQYKKNIPFEDREAINKLARVQTFTDELTGAYKAIDDLAHKNSLTRYLFLFTKTPMNLAFQRARYTPLPLYKEIQKLPGIRNTALGDAISDLGIYKDFDNAMKEGGAEYQEALGKIALGTIAMTAYAGLNISGAYHGTLSTNGNTRKQLNDIFGIQPHTFANGVPYDKDGPMGAVMGLTADLMQLKGHIDDRAWDQLLLGVALTTAKFMTPDIYINGFNEISLIMEGMQTSVDDENKIERLKSQMAKTLGRRHTPALIREVRKITDPKKRMSVPNKDISIMQTLLDTVAMNVPGLSSEYGEVVNRMGQPVYYPPGVGIDVANALWSPEKQDRPIHKELLRLGVGGTVFSTKFPEDLKHLEIKRLPYDLPSGKSEQFRGASLDVKIRLTTEEYVKYTKLAAGVDSKFNRIPIMDALDSLVQSNNYKTLSLVGKMDRIKEIFNRYKKRAQQEMRLDPVIKDKIREEREKQRKLLRMPDVASELE